MPMVLALVAHLALIAALTWGVRWQQEPEPMAFEAELWSTEVQAAAPREVKRAPPKVEPKVEPKPTPPKPEPKPEPEPEPKAAPKPPDTREADIAIEQAKKKKEEAAKKREAEKREAEKKAVAKKKADEEAREKEKKAALAKQKAEDQKRLDDKIKKQLAEDKARKLQEQREIASAKARDEQMRRIMGQAGATGGANATGSAQRSSGPSAGYAGRIRARVKPNVLFTDDIAGNPKAEVEVRSAPDGTIISRRLARSSGNAAWDRAALAAIDRTGVLPRDTDGSVPSPMIIELRPRD